MLGFGENVGTEGGVNTVDVGLMDDLPREDDPDVIIKPDDPRLAAERTAWAATRKAQALHSAEEVLAGLSDDDWHVRHESSDRLKARWHDDPRTFPRIVRTVPAR